MSTGERQRALAAIVAEYAKELGLGELQAAIRLGEPGIFEKDCVVCGAKLRLACGSCSPSGDGLARIMGEFAPNSNVFPDKHEGNLCDALWSLCQRHGERRLAGELQEVSNKMRAAQWDVFRGRAPDGAG